jgi:acyl phosphate:glycerol-3-phosphate acyltransferase
MPIWLIACIPIAYLLGSIPFGLLVGLAHGVDVRTAGSKNIGATNVGRLLGRQWFVVVFLLDLLKGLVPMVVAGWLAASQPPSMMLYLWWLGMGLAAVLGHMFSVFLKFRGGKGVSTSAGVILGLWPYFTLPAIGAIIFFLSTLQLTRYVSLASMIGSSTFPILYLVMGLQRGWDPLGRQSPLLVFAILVPTLIVYKHRANIARLRAGTESRLGSGG